MRLFEENILPRNARQIDHAGINEQDNMELGILPLITFYPWRLFCHNHLCVFILPLFAIILQVTLWHVDSAPALKCNGYKIESWLAGHLTR